MKKYEKICSAYLMSQWGKLPKEARDTPWPKFIWKMHVEMRNLADYDNLVAMAKYPLDVLKKMRIITDDNPRVAVLGAVPTQEIIRKGDRKLYLEVEFEKDNP